MFYLIPNWSLITCPYLAQLLPISFLAISICSLAHFQAPSKPAEVNKKNCNLLFTDMEHGCPHHVRVMMHAVGLQSS